MIGLILSALAFTSLRNRAHAEQTHSFAKRAASLAAGVRSSLGLPVEVLEGIRSMLAAHPDLSGDGFARYVSSPLERHPALTALEWAPVVPGELREAFETRARDQGLVGFRITELAEGGMTMIVVTHEMGFAREVADQIVFIDDGEVVEAAAPSEFFANPREERTRQFLSQILSH